MSKSSGPRPRTATRDRVIDCALSLFQTQGYRGTGLNQIIAESGAPKGSLYHYFPEGKDQLACAVIDQASRVVIVELSRRMVGVTSVSELITRLFDYFVESMEASDFKKGCPIATITLEEAGENERIRAACAQSYQSWLFMLAQAFIALGIAAPERVANQLLSSVEGALILSRVRKSIAPLVDMRDALLWQLAPAPSGG